MKHTVKRQVQSHVRSIRCLAAVSTIAPAPTSKLMLLPQQHTRGAQCEGHTELELSTDVFLLCVAEFSQLSM